MKGERTRQHVVDVAASLFWRRSYHAVGMADIAREAEVNKATPYQYFESKEALALAVIERNLRVTLEHVFDAAFAAHDQPLKRLAGIYRRVTKMHEALLEESDESPGCPFGNLGAELATGNEAVRLKVCAAMDRFGTYYRDILRGHRGGRTAGEAADVASLLRNMNGAMLTSKLERRPGAILDALPLARAIVTG